MMTAQEVETTLKNDDWFEVKEPDVAPSSRRYRHPTKTDYIDIEAKPGDVLSPGAVHGILKRAKIVH